MSIRKGSTIVAYGKNETEIIPRDLGEIVYSSIPLKNSNYHLADGSVLRGDGIYKDFVDYMKDKYNSIGSVWSTPVQIFTDSVLHWYGCGIRLYIQFAL